MQEREHGTHGVDTTFLFLLKLWKIFKILTLIYKVSEIVFFWDTLLFLSRKIIKMMQNIIKKL